MVTFSSFFSSALVGLDVQPGGLRLVQVRKKRHALVLEQAAFSAWPQAIFSEGKIKRWDVLESVLSPLVQALALTGLTAATHLPADKVRMQRMTLPNGLPQADIEKEIYAQVQRDLPGMTDALCLDFVLTPDKTSAYANVFFALAREEYVSQYVKCINACGLKLKILDIDIYAVTRAVCQLASPVFTAGKVNAILYIVNELATFIVFNAHDILFHQQWESSASVDVTTELNNALHVFHAAFGEEEIAALFLCHKEATNQEKITAKWLQAWPFPVYRPDLFNHIKLNNTLNKAQIKEGAVDFLLACGCALRECPLW